MSTLSKPLISLAVIVLAVALAVLVIPAGAQAVPAEEFVGPFPSWRQVQCTGVDDTAMLQAELNTLGRSGSPVLYIKAGTCRITSTLRVGQGAGGNPGGVQNITILGHDPADTKILWAGPSGGRMWIVNGVGHSRFGRMTWDGAGLADMGWLDATSKAVSYFPTGNRHEDIWIQGVRGVGYYLGAADTGTSESEFMRMRFTGPMQMGIFLGNANTLDHWLWDSLCQNVDNCIGNFIDTRGGTNGAGGDLAVNRSVLLNNGNDIVFANAQPFGSSRWNYSRTPKIHVNGSGVGRVNASFTIQGTLVLDPRSPSPAADQNNGPFGILDSIFRGGKAEGMLGVHEAYCSTNCMGDLWAIGNTFSNTSPSQYAIPYPCCGRAHIRIDDTLGQAITDPGPPALPIPPPTSTAPVIEVVNGNIAAALAGAGNQRVTVHIPYGIWNVPQTLDVGPNVTLTGDGYGATQLIPSGAGVSPILRLHGPSHAVIRDLALRGWSPPTGRVTTGLLIDNADQPGGLVHAENSFLQLNRASWDIANLSQTVVDLFDDNNGANTHCGMDGAGPDVDYRVTNATLHIFNGAGAGSDAMFEQHGGSIVDMTHYFEGNPGCAPATFMTAGSSGTFVADQGNYAPQRGGIDTSTYSGSFTMIDFANTLALGSSGVTARKFGPNSLIMGFAYGNSSDALAPTFMAPYVYWMGQHVQPANPMPEASAGVANTIQFMRDHLAPLRAAKPLSLAARTANVTDVRLYRVGGEKLTSAFKVTGSGTPPPTDTPVPAATATPTPTAVPPTATATAVPPTATPSPTNTAVPVATATPTRVPATSTATPSSSAYAARWDSVGALSTTARYSFATARIQVTNTGTSAWQAGGSNPVRVTYWWIDSAGKVVKYGDVVAIPRDVPPGGQFTMDLGIVTPGPGTYRLHFALMRAPSTWFDSGTDRAVSIT